MMYIWRLHALSLCALILFTLSILTLGKDIYIKNPTGNNPLPHNTRVYADYNSEDFILIPNTVTLPQASIHDDATNIRSSTHNFQHRSTQIIRGATVLELDHESTPPTNEWTLKRIYNILKSPMIIGFIVLFALAYLLHISFSTMSQEDLKEFSKLSKNFSNFQGFTPTK